MRCHFIHMPNSAVNIHTVYGNNNECSLPRWQQCAGVTMHHRVPCINGVSKSCINRGKMPQTGWPMFQLVDLSLPRGV